jgi:DNA polymerase I-like protein with 3'-5' exonuclease and polymerase domains
VNIEQQLLPMLVQMEQVGIKTDIKKIEKDCKGIVQRQEKRIGKMKALSGLKHFDPGKKESLRELFVDTLEWRMDFSDATLKKLAEGNLPEDEIEFSFDKQSVFKHYDENPHLVSTYLDYQKEQKLYTSFSLPYLEQHILGDLLIHPNNNQIVRTGRMSCTFPNMMQLSQQSREYIVPYNEDYILVNFDLSQIEFRIIVHYINNLKAIHAFNDDPTTDFHTFVAKMCGISRRPAKNINFMLGYGGGKLKCLSMLSSLREIAGTLQTEELRKQKALQVYNRYHEMLPELKPTQYRAGDVLKSRGYVKTLLGRERHLNYEFHFKAFNSVCQGSAADIFKDICLRLQKFLSADCLLHALVHDSFLFSIRKERVKELVPLILAEIESPVEGANLSVPLKAEYGISSENWRYTDKSEIFKSKLENANNELFTRGIL